MQLTVLRKMRYEETFIYIMQYGTMFQYLFAWNKEIYQQHIFLMPSIPRRIGYFFGICNLYTTKELEDGEQIALSGAMASVDELKSIKKTGRKAKRVAKKAQQTK